MGLLTARELLRAQLPTLYIQAEDGQKTWYKVKFAREARLIEQGR